MWGTLNKLIHTDRHRANCGVVGLFFLVTLVMAPAQLIASKSGLDVSLLIRPWTTEEGLPQSSVIALTQTRDGYLWLGTVRGLARFDGQSFTQFDESAAPQLGNSPVVSLFEDSHENLWVGTKSSGVILIRTGRAIPINIDLPEEGDVFLASAAEDKSGTVWLYFSNGQLYRYENGQLTTNPISGTGTLSQLRKIVAEENGTVWAGMSWQQVGISPGRSEGEEGSASVTVEVEQLDYLLASKAGGYWRLANGRIQKLIGTNVTKDYGPYAWTDPVITAACEDDQGNLIIGTYRSGVFWYNKEGQARKVEGLSDDRILSLCFDREGNLWVGTDGGGLDQVKRSPFTTIEGTEEWVIQSTAPDKEDGVWIGCNGGQMAYWFDQGMTQFQVSPDLPSIKSVAVDADGQVWVGTWGRGLFRLESEVFEPIIAVGLFQAAVIAIHQDGSGTLWFGLQETSPDTRNRLARVKEGRLSFLTEADGLPSGPVRALADDPDGNLWIGTSGGGLAKLQGETFTHYRKSTSSLHSDDISALYFDSDGALWIGTIGGGLSKFHNDRWQTFSKQDGLPSNRIGYLMEDDQGYLWLGTDAGLVRIAKSDLDNYGNEPTDSLACRVFGKADGLPTRECTFGSQPAACSTSDGRLWFPTIKGLVTVDPSQLKPNPIPPSVVIESVRVDEHEQMTNALATRWPESVTLNPKNQSLEISYTSLNLGSRDRTQFRYRLQGHDPVWIDAGADQVARYTQLPPGEYEFKVAAANEDHVWSTHDAGLAVIVLPPFWQTAWFIGAAILVSIGLIAGTVYLVSTQRLHRQVALLKQQEALEKERSRIARDLHDQLGANLTQISLLGELAESDQDIPEEVGDHARQICSTARETTRALDEIVWAANPSNDTLEGLVNYVCKYAQDYLALAGIRYRLEVPSPLPAIPLQPELRHNVFLAAKEAVNNVVKHAQACEARVSLKLEEARFTLEIADNGRGPAGKDTKAAKARNGLRNMRKRMEDLKGQFSIESAPEGGSIVRLTAPLQKG